MAKQGNLNDQDVYKQGIYAREELSTTGIGEGIAIPHAQSEAVNAPGLAAMVVDFLGRVFFALGIINH